MITLGELLGGIAVWLITLLQLPLLGAWAFETMYLLFLTISALVARLRECKQTPVSFGFATTHFSIVVPAHDEALVIEQCLVSLSAMDYPAELRRIVVVADNCSDATAQIAADKGATVYERYDECSRGKGYALEWGLRRLLSNDGTWTDAVVIVDADTIADPQFLRWMEIRLRSGSVALQGWYNLLNPFDSWRTALLYSALLLHNRLRPLARQSLGWTTLLKGNGMCFTRSIIERFGWNAYGLTEDIEYTTSLLDAGIRVEPVPQAILYALASRTRGQADPQRIRWEGGRFAAARHDGVRLLRSFLRDGSIAHLDWAVDLLTPPMAILVGMPVLMVALNACLLSLLETSGAPVVMFMVWTWLAVLLAACIHVVGGLLISGADRRAYLYLLATPLFLIWKLQIYAKMLRQGGPREWVRTDRTTIS